MGEGELEFRPRKQPNSMKTGTSLETALKKEFSDPTTACPKIFPSQPSLQRADCEEKMISCTSLRETSICRASYPEKHPYGVVFNRLFCN